MIDNFDILIPVYGQSYALGAIDDPEASPYNIEPVRPERLLMPGDGVGIWPRRAPFQSYQSLREGRDRELHGYPICETICSEVGRLVIDALRSKRDDTTRVVMAVVGQGGQPIVRFAPAARCFVELQMLVETCAAVSRSQGRTLVVPGFVFLQGQADSSLPVMSWTRVRQLIALQQATEAMVRGITGQTQPVTMFNCDPGRVTTCVDGDWPTPEIAIASEEAERLDPGRHVHVGAMYAHQHHIAVGKSGSHPNVVGYRTLGAAVGAAINRHLTGLGYVAPTVDGWSLLDASTVVARLRLPTGAAAVVDRSDTAVKCVGPYALPGAGWSARDYFSIVGGEPISVVDVTVADQFHPKLPPTSIVLHLSRPAGAGLELSYAARRTARHPHWGRSRGLVRSSAEPIVVPNAGEVHAWLNPTVLR